MENYYEKNQFIVAKIDYQKKHGDLNSFVILSGVPG